MITPLSITSLDQGKELARWQVERLYAQTSDTTPETGARDVALEEISSESRAHKPKWRSLFAEFIGLWETGDQVGTRNY